MKAISISKLLKKAVKNQNKTNQLINRIELSFDKIDKRF